jgi:SAM-dependent methyltransferase
MEIREILKHLRDGDQVLDIGCANGYSTVQFASQLQIKILGVDYIPAMIDQANLRLSEMRSALKGMVAFRVGDLTSLDLQEASYDKVIVIRVIINLGTWENQLRGLRAAARVLKRGGTLLLSEATLQGWKNLNRFRREWGLPEIPVPHFNTYLDQEKVVAALGDELRLVEVTDFASSYFVGTRVLKPLLIQALGMDVNVADPDMDWNRWFSQLPAAGDYGTQKLFSFRKR